MQKSLFKNLLILCLLILGGVFLQVYGLLDPEKIVVLARRYADHWWFPIILVLGQILLFTFALAGSVFLWVAATLYPPLVSTMILVTGATLGGISAYFFSRRLTSEWVHKIENSRTYKTLQQEASFFTLFAVRVMPAFPQGLINYSSGILKIRLVYFVPAAILGLSIKSYIFSKVIYEATTSTSFDEMLTFKTYGPLVILAVVMLVVGLIRYKLNRTAR